MQMTLHFPAATDNRVIRHDFRHIDLGTTLARLGPDVLLSDRLFAGDFRQKCSALSAGQTLAARSSTLAIACQARANVLGAEMARLTG